MISEKPQVGPRSNPSEEHVVTQELDAYGVWVKSEAQIISESIPDISDTLNFPDARGAPDQGGANPASSLESREPERSAGPQDVIHRTRQETGEGPSITDRPLPGILRDHKAVDPPARTDEVDDDLSEQIVIEELLAAPVPLLDSGAPQKKDAGLSKKEVSVLAASDTPVNPLEPPKEAHAVPFMQSLDSPEGLQLLKNILEELSLIRHEVSALKELVIRRERAAETGQSQKGDGAEEDDEKVTITGDELTNIFHTTAPIPKSFTATHTAPFAQGMTHTDEEPPQTEYGICMDFKESEPLQDAGTASDGVPDMLDMLKKNTKEDTEERTWEDDTFDIPVHSDTCDETLSDEALGDTWLQDAERPPFPAEEDEGGDRDASPDGVLPPDSADPTFEDFLLDELFIENGSIKDIPLELNSEDEEEIDDAFETIESLIGPEDTEALTKAENPDEGEPPDDTPPFDGIGRGSASEGSGTGPPAPQEQEPHNHESPESSAVSTETSVHRPFHLKENIKNVLVFMDQLLEALPEDKIGEFAESRYFDIYKKLFSELGIV